MLEEAGERLELLEALEDCDKRAFLLGAPNTGKSSLFNVLTGKTAAVANWPGVTVDIEVGKIRYDGRVLCIVDLPGSYGLVPTSPEEVVTREALFRARPDAIVVLLDTTQPEASMNLVVQAIEAFPGRIVVAATKYALSHARGIHIDFEKLQHLLGAPVIKVSALEGIGIEDLLDALVEGKIGGRVRVDYGLLEPYIERLESRSDLAEATRGLGVSPRWVAVQLLAGDEHLYKLLSDAGYSELIEEALRLRGEAERHLGLPVEMHVAERRIEFAERIAREVVVRRAPASSRWQRLIDAFLHPILGPVVSVAGLFATFAVVFAVNLGFPLNMIFRSLGLEGAAAFIEEYNLSTLLGELFAWLSDLARAHLSGQLADLVADGIIGGVGFVLSFLPLIAMVYVSLALLEDSGLAARMAVSFHPLLYRFGLTGRAIFPLIMGVGCNVASVYATRSLSEEERFRAVFAAPFIPCQARLAVMIAFTSVFIEGLLAQSLTMILIYLEAFAAAMLTAYIAGRLVQPRLLARYGLRVEHRIELIMELPEVHRPHWRVIWWQVRDNLVHFLRKAGTVLFVLAIVTWATLSYGPSGPVDDPRDSFAGIAGEYFGGLTHVIGVGEDKDEILGVALLDGLIAKEGVLTAIAITQGYSEKGAEEAIRSLGLTPAQAVAFLVLISLYFPCIATLAAMKSVVKSWRLVAAYAVYSILLAIAFAGATYWVIQLAA